MFCGQRVRGNSGVLVGGSKGVGVLLGTKRRALFKVCARAERGVDVAREDQGPCRPMGSLFMDRVDFVRQLVEQLDGDCIAGFRPVEREDLDAAGVRHRDASDVDCRSPPGADGRTVEGFLGDKAVADCSEAGCRYSHREVVKP